MSPQRGTSIERRETPQVALMSPRDRAEQQGENREETRKNAVLKAKIRAEGKYTNTACIPGQILIEDMWKRGPMEAAYFVLPKDTDALNKLLADTAPDTAPKIQLTKHPVEYPPTPDSPGVKVLLWYCRILYVQVDGPDTVKPAEKNSSDAGKHDTVDP